MTWINVVTTYGTFSKIPQSNLSDKIVLKFELYIYYSVDIDTRHVDI